MFGSFIDPASPSRGDGPEPFKLIAGTNTRKIRTEPVVVAVIKKNTLEDIGIRHRKARLRNSRLRSTRSLAKGRPRPLRAAWIAGVRSNKIPETEGCA